MAQEISDEDRYDQERPGRLSRLGAASRRIIDSQDFDAVLQMGLDSARAPSESRYGCRPPWTGGLP